METLRSCEAYDPQANKWDTCGALEVPRSGSRVVALTDRHIVAVGGCDDVFGRAETQATIEVYSAGADRWALLETRLTVPRTSAGVAAMDGRCVYIAGGAPSQASVELCCLKLLPECCAAQSVDSTAGNTGGSDNPGETCGKRCLAIADMPEARMGCQAAVVSLPRRGPSGLTQSQRCLVVVGGERCDQSSNGLQPLPRVRQLSSVAAYDLEASAWCDGTTVPALAVPRTTMALCLGTGRVAPARLK